MQQEVPAMYRISGALTLTSGLFNVVLSGIWFLALIWVCVGVFWLVPMLLAFVEIGVGIAMLAGVRMPVVPQVTSILGGISSLFLFNIWGVAFEAIATALSIASISQMNQLDDRGL